MKINGVLYKSDRALQAEEEGRFPITTGKQLLKKLLTEHGIRSTLHGCEQLLKKYGDSDEWHHVSKYARKIDYYDVAEVLRLLGIKHEWTSDEDEDLTDYSDIDRSLLIELASASQPSKPKVAPVVPQLAFVDLEYKVQINRSKFRRHSYSGTAWIKGDWILFDNQRKKVTGKLIQVCVLPPQDTSALNSILQEEALASRGWKLQRNGRIKRCRVNQQRKLIEFPSHLQTLEMAEELVVQFCHEVAHAITKTTAHPLEWRRQYARLLWRHLQGNEEATNKALRNAPGCKSQQRKLLEFAKRTHSEVVNHRTRCGGMPKLVKWQGLHWNNLVFGANDVLADVSGTSVGQLQESYREVLNLPADAVAYVDGVPVDSNFVVERGQRIEWMRERGEKGSDVFDASQFCKAYSVSLAEFDWCVNEGMEVLPSNNGKQYIVHADAFRFGRRLMERRANEGKPELKKATLYDDETFSVAYQGKVCVLGNTIQFSLFRKLAQNLNRYVSYSSLMQEGWGIDTPERRAFQRQVSKLKQKLADAGMADLTIDGRNRGHYALKLSKAA